MGRYKNQDPCGFTYNGLLGKWWRRRASDPAHQYAYRNIARYIHNSFSSSPELIADYACGPGDLICRLAWRFPHSRLVGIDGSQMLLSLARQRVMRMGHGYVRRVDLIESPLPDFSLPVSGADLVVYSFPNLVPFGPEDGRGNAGRFLTGEDIEVAGRLACETDENSTTRDLNDPEATRFALLQSRLTALNLRGMLKKGALCVRVEYGVARRHELVPLDLRRVSYEEGSLYHEVAGRKPSEWFRVVASSYFRSRVMEDVYQQTRDKRDRQGGYLITVLQAL